jgi:hypothetical protein
MCRLVASPYGLFHSISEVAERIPGSLYGDPDHGACTRPGHDHIQRFRLQAAQDRHFLRALNFQVEMQIISSIASLQPQWRTRDNLLGTKTTFQGQAKREGSVDRTNVLLRLSAEDRHKLSQRIREMKELGKRWLSHSVASGAWPLLLRSEQTFPLGRKRAQLRAAGLFPPPQAPA